MESNSMEQATQAMEISEEKLVTGHDLSGAMKLALNARRLYPELKGIDQLISVLEVHLAAADPNDCSGKRDYYKILQVDPQAESSVIKKQYRKIALNVHPDKNSSIRAEEAFKMVIEAFEVLSDQRKRELYDQGRRRGLWEIGKVDMESLFRKMNTKEFWEERKRQMSEKEMESLRRMQMSEERSLRRMKEAEERWDKENTKREMESLRRMQMSEERSLRRMKEAEERWNKENTKREMESLRGKWRVKNICVSKHGCMFINNNNNNNNVMFLLN